MAPSSFAKFSDSGFVVRKPHRFQDGYRYNAHSTRPKAGNKARDVNSSDQAAASTRLQNADFEQIPGPGQRHGCGIEQPDIDASHSGDEEVSGLLRPVRHTGLREQHISALTAVLHRCLLEGDYARATRAWGMLLRTEIHGRPLDIRKHGRWGIGAEILAFRSIKERGREKQGCFQLQDDKVDEEAAGRDQSTAPQTRDIEQAKSYYRRLVLQYPYRRIAAKAINPLDFYPALFGLWIYTIQEQHLMDERSCTRDESEWGDDQMEKCTKSVFEKTLNRVNELVNELDELLVSPPHSDSARLWNLRGMSAWWLDDLRENADRAKEGTTVMRGSEAASSDKTEVPRARNELLRAQECFARARALNGTEMPNAEQYAD